MGFRVTNQAMQQSALNNVFRLSEDLFNAQNAISSGKRIQNPSDDPSGTRQTLKIRSEIDKTKQFQRNIKNMQRFTNGVDSALEDIGITLIRARELTIGELNGIGSVDTQAAAAEIDNLIAQTLRSANFEIGNRFVFGGSNMDSAPFGETASGAIYTGNSGAVLTEIDKNVAFQFNIPGSEILAADLDPILTTRMSLSDLNRGAGIKSGSFTITDRAGNTAKVSVSSSDTIQKVIDAINTSGTNVTASLNTDKNGLQLTDSSTLVTNALTIAESGGSTAADLGVLGSRNGDISGLDLDPRLTMSAYLSELNNGNGVELSDIKIINGAASATVSFSSLSSSSTLSDLIDVINGAGVNVTAGIGSGGNDLKVVSNSTTSVAVIQDIGSGSLAENLGLGDGRNVITTLVQLKSALERKDTSGKNALLENLKSGLDAMQEARAKIGAIERRLQTNENTHTQDIVKQTERLADVEDIDFSRKASELAALELAFQATLNTTARILQPSLLNFLS
tara:strand:+ start:114 stop:1637 length:1524 start_codon:yes stop_codon:yes gene_type:complete